jgi:hypothetical protein
VSRPRFEPENSPTWCSSPRHSIAVCGTSISDIVFPYQHLSYDEQKISCVKLQFNRRSNNTRYFALTSVTWKLGTQDSRLSSKQVTVTYSLVHNPRQSVKTNTAVKKTIPYGIHQFCQGSKHTCEEVYKGANK